jgi:predicted enzyme related to lactoylglutathione lyase
VQSPDLAASSAFYQGLFGWTAEDQGEEAGHYTMFSLNGLPVAALGPMQGEGVPPVWTTYLATDDVDQTAKDAEAAGGTVFMPPFDIFDSGRMTVIADTVGAAFGVWQAKDHIGARLVNEPNTLLWNELAARDLDTALEFYGKVFGYTSKVVNVPGSDGPPYRELQVNGQTIGGGMPMDDGWPAEIPPHWMVYFAVEDTDATAAKAKELGGNVNVEPAEIPPGRFAVLSDPVGAHFTILKPHPIQQ